MGKSRANVIMFTFDIYHESWNINDTTYVSEWLTPFSCFTLYHASRIRRTRGLVDGTKYKEINRIISIIQLVSHNVLFIDRVIDRVRINSPKTVNCGQGSLRAKRRLLRHLSPTLKCRVDTLVFSFFIAS